MWYYYQNFPTNTYLLEFSLILQTQAKMEEGLDKDDGLRSISSLRMNIGSSSSRSWTSTSVPAEVWSGDQVFERKNKKEDIDDEEELKWAAIERLPTFERLRKSIVKQAIDSGRFSYEEVDISKLGIHDKNKLMDGILRTIEEDNEKFLLKMRERIHRFFILFPNFSYNISSKPQFLFYLVH